MARRRKRGGNILVENKKSKLVLILLTMTGLSFFGLDRIYSNQIGLGLLKFFTAGGFRRGILLFFFIRVRIERFLDILLII